MWIVRNVLRGSLRFADLGQVIPPRAEIDLDRLLGRERAEASTSIKIALDEGYLQNVHKEGPAHDTISPRQLSQQLESFKASILQEMRASLPEVLSGQEIKTELGHLHDSVLGGVRELFEKVRIRLREERARVAEDHTLTDAEVRARLAFLEEKERELEANFERLGHEAEPAAGPSQLAHNAELLGGIGTGS
jgi:hypothetical protein